MEGEGGRGRLTARQRQMCQARGGRAQSGCQRCRKPQTILPSGSVSRLVIQTMFFNKESSRQVFYFANLVLAGVCSVCSELLTLSWEVREFFST